MDVVLILSIVGMILIVLGKLINLANGGTLYSAAGALLTGGIGLILWSFVFFIFNASITDQSISTITGAPSGTITVIEQGAMYVGLLPFMNFANILLVAVLFLSVVEIFASAGNTAIQMRPGPRAEQYR